MDKKKVREFLENFDLDKEVIDGFVSDEKEIEKKNVGVYLVDEKFSYEEVYREDIVFVNLKEKLLPSKFLLEFLNENSKRKVIISNRKNALNFTYGKNLSKDMVESFENGDFEEGKYYTVEYEGNVLGYVEFLSKNKMMFKNKMHIGEYLKEN